MMLKKVLTLMLAAFCLCTSLAITAFAANEDTFYDEEISLPYEIAKTPSSTLYINGTTATCESRTSSYAANRIGVLQVLQKWGGFSTGYVDVPHANWVKCVFRDYCYFCNTFSGLASGTYRVKTIFTLYDDNGNREEITIYSPTETVS